ncbi:hypothetical protein BC567DRAFT_37600 [Phyllosticta citribraziliensis]
MKECEIKERRKGHGPQRREERVCVAEEQDADEAEEERKAEVEEVVRCSRAIEFPGKFGFDYQHALEGTRKTQASGSSLPARRCLANEMCNLTRPRTGPVGRPAQWSTLPCHHTPRPPCRSARTATHWPGSSLVLQPPSSAAAQQSRTAQVVDLFVSHWRTRRGAPPQRPCMPCSSDTATVF